MVDRIVEEAIDEIPEMPEIVEQVILFALDEGRKRLEADGEMAPFTALVVKDKLFLETHPGETPEACFASARKAVAGARGADAYAFCYDGYVETDEGTKDALIAEGGEPGAAESFAVGSLYEMGEDGGFAFEEEPAYIGPAPNFMENLRAADEYADDEIDEVFCTDDDECASDCGCGDDCCGA